MSTPEGIELVRAPYSDVLSLLKSNALNAAEQPIAKTIGFDIIYDYSVASVARAQKEISVSGMSPSVLERYLTDYRDAIIQFAIRCAQSTGDSDADLENGQSIGFANGFGISRAILHNFLANRTRKELIAFLKNRRIPAPTKEAKCAQEIFDSLGSGDWQPPRNNQGCLPVSHDDLRDLFEHLDNKTMAGYACNHRFTLATAFLQSRNLPVEEMIDWFGNNGAGCDCEIMFNVAEQWENVVGYTPADETDGTK